VANINYFVTNYAILPFCAIVMALRSLIGFIL